MTTIYGHHPKPNDHQTDVEVELHELLDWGHDYEHFDNLLSEKVGYALEGGLEVEGVDLDDLDFFSYILVVGYEMTSVPRPNVVMFSVLWQIDA